MEAKDFPPEDEDHQEIELPPTSSPDNPTQVEPIFCTGDCGFGRSSLTTWSTRITGTVSVADWAIKYWTKGVTSKFISMRVPESDAINKELLRTAPYIMSVRAMPSADPTNNSDTYRFFFSERSPDGMKRSIIELSLPRGIVPSRFNKWPAREAFACVDHRVRYWVELWYDREMLKDRTVYDKALWEWARLKGDSMLEEMKVGRDVFWDGICSRSSCCF
ncbi:hypothetical protein GLAREA_05280 [Glarea lozoyensis ATCC 20868]|uniref:Uncharacterized protein n=1 Tax=Glarea lozoyensis (strain ATCC 20868 / MF5171) TaxID=1116229 RepID=S3DBY8_GLAL2|nr:uncharacterized protein GLAREA_05280 [Glarea lozoyensis ATCC 20868]EPE35942.1 hypothetical protein GLAREA_05280 [Glarea lozoyensis ATCC 20868]